MTRLELVNLDLPKSTQINRFIPKSTLYKQASITPKIHDLLEQQVERITWTNKIAPTTINISSVDIAEIQIFHIQLKAAELNNDVLIFIQKSIPYPILFIVSSIRGVQAIAITKNTDSKPVVIATNWQNKLSLELKGNSTDLIYKNYLLQLSPTFAATGGNTEKYTQTKKLEREIEALTAKIRREAQINKRQELARQLHSLKLQLQELIS